jgi:hypothetical protein
MRDFRSGDPAPRRKSLWLPVISMLNPSLEQHMQPMTEARVETDSLSDFAKILKTDPKPKQARNASDRLNVDQDSIKNGLGQLVLTLVKLLHELLERQAIRRMEAGSLTDSEIENLGLTLMMQAQEIERLRKVFNLEDEDLNLDLGPLGKLF